MEPLRAALTLAPEHLEARNNLAWLLATCPDERLRNGAEAVRLAEELQRLAARARRIARKDDAAQQVSKLDVEYLDTLAAAYAEVNRFADASATVQRARALAADAGHADLAQKLDARAELYRAQRPHRMPAEHTSDP